MRSLLAFTKKECLEQLRSGRLTILAILFVLFGIMNPAVAKLTPWLLEAMADSLAESGMTVTEVTVSALDSWTQFFKNMPVALIVFVLMQSGAFAKEYEAGTLILPLTKGIERFKVVLAKSGVLAALWTACYFICFAVTYAYTAYFWDNSVAQNLGFSVVCWWIFGLLTLFLTVLFSTLVSTVSGVLMGTGATVLAFYLLGLFPKIGKYLPARLTEGKALVYGAMSTEAYATALVITVLLSVICLTVSLIVFNKKQL